ncbi:MAG: response regulator [Rhodocyclales bacterium]|nr:response regulator [Rhodocyclales bacterium]
MEPNDEAFRKRLLNTFKGEAAEHVQALFAGLLALEKASSAEARQELVETVFRETHSLKGAARAVGLSEMESLCQSMESALALLKRGEVNLAAALSELLYQTVELLAALLAAVDEAPTKAQESAARSLRRRLAAVSAAEGAAVATAGEEAAPVPVPGVAGDDDAAVPQEIGRPRAVETVRVPVTRLDAILFQAEALLSAKLTARQRAEDIRCAQADFSGLARSRARIAPDVRALQRRLERAERGGERGLQRSADLQMRRLLDYLAQHDEFARAHGTQLEALARAAGHDGRVLGGMVDGLLDDVKRALMLPLASAIEFLPRFVRDGARSQGKEVDFRVVGGNVEIDRRIIEELRDPLLHLIRNSIDHGIEIPSVRLAAGKPRCGRIDLQVAQTEGGRVEIVVADDGAGIAFDRVREAARKMGFMRGEGEGEAPDEAALLDLMFRSGLSTSPIITDFSGRGLGLAIVREKTERLGGAVSATSSPGAGTRFRLVLPLTLSTFRGVHVRCGDREFIVPTLHLALVTRVARAAIGSVENRETVHLGGQTVALARLARVLDLPTVSAAALADTVPVVVAGSGEGRIAFLVDEVLGEQEVLVKSLGRQLRRVRNVFGATVLGSGKVLPILHVPDLLKSARCAAAPVRQPQPETAEGARSLLVAEDSITSRMLLKGILESAGYLVKTAVDGVDAFTQLRTEPFDLLVSDVDMPRMDGFDLTARVRADRTLAELPVVLVTALDSQQHKERGAEVGANAYIVKSSFDQSNLLAVIRRLL